MSRKRYDRQFKLAAARLVLEGEIPTKQISEGLNVLDNTLRRWATEYEREGEAAFPGSGSPTINKDYEILKLKKHIEELELENNLLKKFRLGSIGQCNTSSSLAAGVINPNVFLGWVLSLKAISSNSPWV